MPARKRSPTAFWATFAGAIGFVILLVGLATIMLSSFGSRRGITRRAVAAERTARDARLFAALSDPRTRGEAARHAGLGRNAAAVDVLRQFAWKSTDVAFRKTCVWALGEIGNEEAVHCLSVVAGADEPEIHVAVAEALGKINVDAGVPTLVRMLRDGEPAARKAAADALRAAGRPEAIAALAGSLKEDPDPTVRAAALDAVRGDGAAALRQDISRALLDPSPLVRGAATRALRSLGGAFAEESSRSEVNAASDVARVRDSLSSLARKPTPGNMRLMLEALDRLTELGADRTTQDAARSQVVDALAGVGPSLLGPLRAEVLCADERLSAKRVAAEVCVRWGTNAVPAICERILAWKVFPDPEELGLWIETLGRIGDPRAVPALDHAGMSARFHAELAKPIADVRRRLTSREGTDPAVAPVAWRPPDPVDPPARLLSRVARAAVSLPARGLPADGVARVTLGGGVRDASGTGSDLAVELVRRGGRWESDALADMPGVDRDYNECAVSTATNGTGEAVDVALFARPCGSFGGGYGRYRIRFGDGGSRAAASYDSEYDGIPLKGPAAVEWDALPPSGTADEPALSDHPRLLFRAGDLPWIRARAGAERGRRLVAALLRRSSAVGPGIEDRLDAAVGCGVLGFLIEDKAYGRRAARWTLECVREPASGSLADRARRLRLAALAYDLAYAEFTGQERSEVSDNLGRFAGIFMPQHGMIGDYRFSAATALPCGAGSAAVGLAALASLGERGAFRAPESRAAPVQVGEARLGDGAPSAGRSRLNEALAARWRTARERHARTEEAVHVRPALLAASRDARRCLSMVAAMAGAGRDAPDALQARDTMDGLHAFAAACETAGMPPLLQASADPWVCAFGIGREQAERIAEQPGAASCLKLAQVLIADGVACPR